MRNTTGCDGVMIGRIAIGNPWVFSQILERFQDQPILKVDLASRFEVMVRYVRLSVKYSGETPACYMMRSRPGLVCQRTPPQQSFP